MATGGSLAVSGTSAERARLLALIDDLRLAGPAGRALIEGLEQAPGPTEVFVGTVALRADGTVIPLVNTGGGVTLRPSESPSGNTEVHIDPTNLINYRATDGTVVVETPQGLLLHELGHAALLNAGDPAQLAGGVLAEANVRALTNPVRQELGMKPER